MRRKNYVAACPQMPSQYSKHKCNDRTQQKERDDQQFEIALKRLMPGLGLALPFGAWEPLTARSKAVRLIIGNVAVPESLVHSAPSPTLGLPTRPPLRAPRAGIVPSRRALVRPSGGY